MAKSRSTASSASNDASPVEKKVVKEAAPKLKHAKDLGCLLIRRIGVDEITGKPTSKAFECTYNKGEWNNLLKNCMARKSGSDTVITFGAYVVLDVIQTPEGSKTIDQRVKEILGE